MPGIGPRPYMYRYLLSEAMGFGIQGPLVYTSAEFGLQGRPSRFDSYLRDIDGSSPFTLMFAGNASGVDYPFQTEMDQGELKERVKSRRAKRKRQEEFLDEWLTENRALVMPPLSDLLFFYNPDDAGELRRAQGRRRRGSFLQRAELPGDLPYLLADLPALVYQVTVRDILNEIQYHMLEPIIDGGLTWQFWTFDEVFGYLVERITRFLLETKIIKDRTSLALTAGVSTYNLDPNLVDLYRVYGQETGVIARTDRWTLDNANSTWASRTATTPKLYVEDPINPLSALFTPIPTQASNVNYHFIKQTPLSQAIGQDETLALDYPLRIPSLFTWAIKYGVMADMLTRQGEGNDPKRAAYAETRFRDGLELASLLMGDNSKKGGE